MMPERRGARPENSQPPPDPHARDVALAQDRNLEAFERLYRAHVARINSFLMDRSSLSCPVSWFHDCSTVLAGVGSDGPMRIHRCSAPFA